VLDGALLLGLIDGCPAPVFIFIFGSIAMIFSLVPLSEPLVRNSHRSSRYEKEARAMPAE
jgi:hypothetical protein